MKTLLTAFVVLFSVNSFSQSCNENAQYNCHVNVDGNVISLLIKDIHSGVEQTYETMDCSRHGTQASQCKVNFIWAYGDQIKKFRNQDFCR